METIKVIYILGEGRSGSTLVERVLGQHSEIFAAGELKHIWERSFHENQLCSCGAAFFDCEVWKEIRDALPATIEPDEQIEAQEKISRLRHFFTLKRLLKKNSYQENQHLMTIIDAYYELYKSILKVSGKSYVLDASKHPVFAFLLSMHPHIELHIIHLVRDVRGVAYSWRKKKIRPEITTHQEYMPRYSVVRTAISWDIVNYIGNAIKKHADSYMLLRYEDIMEHPKKEIKEVFKSLNLQDETDHIFIDDHTVQLHPNHTVAGNPMRFKTGNIHLKLDEEWEKKMRQKDRFLTTLFSKRFLKKYGFIGEKA